MEPNKKKAIFSVTGAHILLLCVCLLLLLANEMLSRGALPQENKELVYIVVQIVVYLLPVVFYATIRRGEKNSLYRANGFSLRNLPFMITIALLLLAVTGYLEYVGISFFDPAQGMQSSALEAGASNPLYLLLAGAFLPALCEEILLRGVLLTEYSRAAGAFGGILATSAAFAMLHLSVREFPVYFVAGLLLGALTHVTGSVYPAILLHFLNNTVNLFGSKMLVQFARQGVGGPIILVTGGIVILLLLIVALQLAERICLTKSLELSEEHEDTAVRFFPGKGQVLTRMVKLFLSPVFLTVIAIFILNG